MALFRSDLKLPWFTARLFYKSCLLASLFEPSVSVTLYFWKLGFEGAYWPVMDRLMLEFWLPILYLSLGPGSAYPFAFSNFLSISISFCISCSFSYSSLANFFESSSFCAAFLFSMISFSIAISSRILLFRADSSALRMSASSLRILFSKAILAASVYSFQSLRSCSIFC